MSHGPRGFTKAEREVLEAVQRFSAPGAGEMSIGRDRIIRRLIAEGLIERRPDSSRGVLTRLVLTEDGYAALPVPGKKPIRHAAAEPIGRSDRQRLERKPT